MVALFVILTVIAFIAIDALVQRAEAREQRRAQLPALTSRERRGSVLALEGVSVPQGMFFDVGHTWVDLDSSGRVRVGVDDFAQRAIGRIDAVEMLEVGRPVRRGETLFVVRQGERTAAFVAPVDGVVAAVNERLARRRTVIHNSAFASGRCSPSDPHPRPPIDARRARRSSMTRWGHSWRCPQTVCPPRWTCYD